MAREAADTKQRPLGPRALRTRERLLQTAAALLEERGLRGLSVVEIARRAETSPATFYQYFGGVLEATLTLSETAAADLTPLLGQLAQPFDGPGGLARARAFVAAFLDLWEEHRAVWRVRNHSAEEGEPRFRRLRRRALRPLLDRLAATVTAAEGGAPGKKCHPYALAAALVTILESLGAYGPELEPFGVDRDALVETGARLLVDATTGPWAVLA
jgi:AcrR family transcriptional regulator